MGQGSSLGADLVVPRVSYSEFRQGVLQYRPSNLLPVLARYSAAMELRMPPSRTGEWFPWAVSAIAKESVLSGNEFMNAEIDVRGLKQLVHLLNVSADLVPNQSVSSLVTPIMYEQFPYQESIYEELARTHALLVHNEPGQTPIQWEDLLGIGLDEAIRGSMVLHAWVMANAGRFDPGILDMAHFQQVYKEHAPRQELERTASLLFANIPELRKARLDADERARVPERLERYGFNPLKSTPFVDLGTKGIWAPQSMFVSRAFTGPNLYYRGIRKWGSAYADGLGDRTQRYVGRQLALMEGIKLYPEIEYKKSHHSVDWLWVSDSAVILVECKAARLTLDAQAGGDSLVTVMERYLGAARRQIDTTARLIRDGHRAFDDIPKDRPIVGVVTTAEQFYPAGTPFSGFDSSGMVPVTNISLRDLEYLVGMSESEAAEMVIDHAHPEGEGGRFGGAFSDDVRKRRNPILKEAWDNFESLAKRIRRGSP